MSFVSDVVDIYMWLLDEAKIGFPPRLFGHHPANGIVAIDIDSPMTHVGSLRGINTLILLVGRTIADRSKIFDDNVRNAILVKVLDAFDNMGWRDARSLLFRLSYELR